MWSITTTSTLPVAGCSLSPSCSCRAVNKEGPFESDDSPLLRFCLGVQCSV